tara:strand:+ start:336 stop:614 length:279 start_codon:yes stop_codon:yes gene_type:complete
MANLTKDDAWKMLQIVMSALVLPLAAWVWNTNVKVAELQNDLGDAEEVIAELEQKVANTTTNAKNIIGIEKDIEYMRGSLGRIESMVTRRNK